MKEIIEFPDAEALLLTYLNGAYPTSTGYTSVKAYVDVPATRPGEFTRLYRVGGSAPNPVIERVTLVVDCYATTSVRAAGLARRTAALILAADNINGTPIYDPQIFAGPANLPDPNVGTQRRYTMTVSVGVRGIAI